MCTQCGPGTLICNIVNTISKAIKCESNSNKHIHFTLTQLKDSDKNSSLSQHQSRISGNWLIFITETQPKQNVNHKTQLSSIVFSVSMEIQTCGQ